MRPAPYRRAARAVVPYSRNVQKPNTSDEEQPGERQAGQRHRAEVADDGGVAEHVERLGDERAEGGDREREDLAVGRHPRRAAHAA